MQEMHHGRQEGLKRQGGKGELQKSRGKSGGKNDEAGLFHVKQYIHKGQQLISGSSVKR